MWPAYGKPLHVILIETTPLQQCEANVCSLCGICDVNSASAGLLNEVEKARYLHEFLPKPITDWIFREKAMPEHSAGVGHPAVAKWLPSMENTSEL